MCVLEIGTFERPVPGSGFDLLTWVSPGKPQEGQKMTGSGLWVQENPDLGPEPGRSLVRTRCLKVRCSLKKLLDLHLQNILYSI